MSNARRTVYLEIAARTRKRRWSLDTPPFRVSNRLGVTPPSSPGCRRYRRTPGVGNGAGGVGSPDVPELGAKEPPPLEVAAGVGDVATLASSKKRVVSSAARLVSGFLQATVARKIWLPPLVALATTFNLIDLPGPMLAMGLN